MSLTLDLQPLTGRPRRDANGTPLAVRLSRSIDYRGPDSCWIWHGSRLPDGYGQIRINGRTRGAHRVVYELLVGPIPDGLTLDHLCRTHACVNPRHLEPVTMRENTLRGVGPSARNATATHCHRGHEFTEANTHTWNGHRSCRACRGLNYRARQANREPRVLSPRCVHGHDYTPENTYMWRGARVCRTCSNSRGQQYKAKVRAQLKAAAS